MFYKSLEMEIKADADKRTFEGYASKFGNIDLHGDVIQKGAFTQTIAERHPRKSIKILWQHSDPLGIPNVLEEREDGLYVEGHISKTRLGDEAITLMKDGVVDGMSIGYDVEDDEYDNEHNVRYLKRLKLYEVSVVTWGANPEAMITNVKHIEALQKAFSNENLTSLLDMKKQLDDLNHTLQSGVFNTKDGNIIINMEELKAGAVLNRKNRDNLSQAMNLIQSVLDTAESNDDKSKEKEDESKENIELKDLLSEIRSYTKK